MSKHQLAQVNIAKARYPLMSPEMSGFVDNLENINALADQAPGFVWRLQTEEGDATDIDFFGSDVIVNMSVWTDIESLHNYVYRTAHAKIMSQRKQWFERIKDAYTVLWWIPSNSIPSLQEAKDRLALLAGTGSTVDAFTFKKAFPAPDQQADDQVFDDLCPAT